MNRKFLFVVLTLAVVLLATPYIGMVSAGKGQTKQYYEFYLEGGYMPGPEFREWTTKDGIQQIRGLLFYATYIEVTVGDVHYYPDVATYSCTMDLTIDTTTGYTYVRIWETFEVAGGTISHHTAEAYDAESAGGNFVGFGSGALEGVKIQGTTVFTTGLDRVGTIMGWP